MADLGAIGVTHNNISRQLNVVVRSNLLGSTAHVSGFGRVSWSNPLPVPHASVSTTAAHKRGIGAYTKNIQVWSVRKTPAAAPTKPAQVYLLDTPGSIVGQVKTGIVIDYNHIVRLYYRPNGYLIDQVRTNYDGTFTFNRNIDKSEIGNYYIMAFDLNGNFNAVVFDLLTPG